jgi:hypothetical protein
MGALICFTAAMIRARIIAAVKNINAPMLRCVRQEPEYLIDACRVTRGAHIEHRQLSKKTFLVFVWL